ncbi:MAG TPA: GNAT family N-acetyltransferase [Flavobacteriaceae bacterium]|nr:GNAT family N-acetyltransferase [Flavobacteriaceae bacterium]
MKGNPFLSETYQNSWLKHFSKSATANTFNFISGIGFLKKKLGLVYVNVGLNHTNGTDYKLLKANDFKGKVFLVYDVQGFIDIGETNADKNLKVNKVKQYKGSLAKFEGFDTFEAYLKSQISAKGRSKLRGLENKLHKDFTVEIKQFYGSIEENEYNFLMERFYSLLKQRFDQLGLDNDILQKWDFYHEVSFKLVNEGRAVFNVVMINGNVGAISLEFVSDHHVIGAIKTFDIQYSQYRLGNIELNELLKWTFENKFEALDFSKGDQEYKSRFTNEDYDFECHILYDKSSVVSRFIGLGYVKYFEFKQYLRDKDINTKVSKLKHKLKSLKR